MKTIYTPAEIAGKFIVRFPVISGKRPTFDCVRYSGTYRDNKPYLYNSIDEAKNDKFFDPDNDEIVPAEEFFNPIKKTQKMEKKEVYFIRIPHQMSVTVGKCTDTRQEAEDDINHDDWAFWNDSHATYTFTSIKEMKEWGKSYSGHQWASVQAKVENFQNNKV